MIDDRAREIEAEELVIPKGLTMAELLRLCTCGHDFGEHRLLSLHPASEAPCAHDDLGDSCRCPEFVSLGEYRDLKPFVRIA